jgi:MEMO1 family protein
MTYNFLEIRNPVVAGKFYPKNKENLLEELKNKIKKEEKKENVIAAISPHAGYMYSGKTAGKVFSKIKIPQNIFILSPNHTGIGHPISLHPTKFWSTPLGKIEVNLDILKKLESSLSFVKFDELAQAQEHALEVQLPFIQFLNPSSKIIPITISEIHPDAAKKIGIEIIKSVSNLDFLVLASSDMNHFESLDINKKKDEIALNKIKELDSESLIEKIRKNKISMCGVFPIMVMIEAINYYKKTKNIEIEYELLDYSSSADVTKDKKDVVTYAGVIFKKKVND